MRFTRLDHAMNQMQCLANTRTTVNNVAKKQRLALRVAPDASLHPIAHQLKQALQRMRTTVHIANDVVTLILDHP